MTLLVVDFWAWGTSAQGTLELVTWTRISPLTERSVATIRPDGLFIEHPDHPPVLFRNAVLPDDQADQFLLDVIEDLPVGQHMQVMVVGTDSAPALNPDCRQRKTP